MGRYNLLFFASGGGKFNYQGTKRWLEDNLDHTGELRAITPGCPLARILFMSLLSLLCYLLV